MMATNRKRKLRAVVSRLSEDQEQHVCEGWALDGCVPWHGVCGFPFRDPEHRAEVWKANRDFLLAKYPGATLAAQVDYEGVTAHPSEYPNVWAARSKSGELIPPETSGQEADLADE
jgi:hypothetical protein